MKNKETEKNLNMISGIHNYCDSWCEHCEFTQQCATFVPKMEADAAKSEEQMFEMLVETLLSTMQMVRDWAEKNGVDLDSTDYDEYEKKEQYINKQADSFECSILGKEYIDLTEKWLDSYEYIFKNRAEELIRLEENGIPNISFEKEIKELNDSIEIICWYKHLIYAKIRRAVTGRVRDGDIDDCDGSAKVALIGIDRSIGAWGKLLSVFPEQEDELLNILVLLERLRRSTENEFPKARDFIRPGFDE